METSIFIAKIMGVTYLSIAAGLILSRDYYKRALSRMMDDPAYLMLGGVLSMIFGFLIINYHTVSADWTVLVCVIGWAALIKGIVLLVFPKLLKGIKPLLLPHNLNKFMFPTVLILGLVFAYFGFLA